MSNKKDENKGNIKNALKAAGATGATSGIGTLILIFGKGLPEDSKYQELFTLGAPAVAAIITSVGFWMYYVLGRFFPYIINLINYKIQLHIIKTSMKEKGISKEEKEEYRKIKIELAKVYHKGSQIRLMQSHEKLQSDLFNKKTSQQEMDEGNKEALLKKYNSATPVPKQVKSE